MRDLLQGRRCQLFAGVSEHAAQMGVRLDEPVVEAQHGHSDGGVLDGQPQPVVQSRLFSTCLTARHHGAPRGEHSAEAEQRQGGQQRPLTSVVGRHRGQDGGCWCIQHVGPSGPGNAGRSEQAPLRHSRLIERGRQSGRLYDGGCRPASRGDDRLPRRVDDVAPGTGDRLTFQERGQRTLCQAEAHGQRAVAPGRQRKGERHGRLALRRRGYDVRSRGTARQRARDVGIAVGELGALQLGSWRGQHYGPSLAIEQDAARETEEPAGRYELRGTPRGV